MSDVDRWYEWFKEQNKGAEPTEAQADEVDATKQRCYWGTPTRGVPAGQWPRECQKMGVTWTISLLSGPICQPMCEDHGFGFGGRLKPFHHAPDFFENM